MKNKNSIYLTISPFLWLMFITNLFILITSYFNFTDIYFGNILRITRFSLLISTVVSFFSAVVSTYESRYLSGFKYHNNFKLFSLGFTFSVILFVMSNHIILFIGTWFFMGYFTSCLIGVNKDWEEAKQASRFAQRNFLFSTILLSIGIFILALSINNFTVSGLVSSIASIPWNMWIKS